MASRLLAKNVIGFAKRSLTPRVSTSVAGYSKYPPYYDPAEGKEGR